MNKIVYGTMPDGTVVEQYTLTGKGGLTVRCITYGAIITNVVFDGKDVVLGQDRLHDYFPCIGYIGTTVGRYANRIAGGKFELGGKTYDVGCNEREGVHLHGGERGFDKYVWDVIDASDNHITMRHISKDGDMGYPSTLTLDVTFTVEDDDTLAITYHATADGDTILNPTNHTYFNLNGYDGGDILDTELWINADTILEVDEYLLPTGNRLPVVGTPFDFTTPKPIGRDIAADHPQIKLGGGYDHNFCIADAVGYRHIVSAYSPRSGIRMDCYSTEPGVQLYTGNGLESDFGKGGPMSHFQGFCLETQHFPDSPNHPEFPTTVLKGGEVFESITRYHFSK